MAWGLSTINSWRLMPQREKKKMAIGDSPLYSLPPHFPQPPTFDPGLGLGLGLGSPIIGEELKRLMDKFVYTNQNLSAAQQQQLAQAQQCMQNSAEEYKPSPHAKAITLLKMRLAGVGGNFDIAKDEFLVCHVAKDTVYTFFVINGKGGVLEEETALFPSDKLITQLRLIR